MVHLEEASGEDGEDIFSIKKILQWQFVHFFQWKTLSSSDITDAAGAATLTSRGAAIVVQMNSEFFFFFLVITPKPLSAFTWHSRKKKNTGLVRLWSDF